jgi:hypothetical protein
MFFPLGPFRVSRPPRPAATWLLIACLGATSLAAETPAGGDEPKIRAILTRWIEAIGGQWEIKQLKSADYHCKINFGPALPSIDTYVRATSAGAYRYDYELPAYGRLTQAFDGQSVWQKNDVLGFGPLSAPVHAQNLAETDFHAPLRVGSTYPDRKLLPDETIEGRRLQVLEMGDSGGIRSKWYFDPSTGLRVRMSATIGAQSLSIDFSDFRRVQGIQEPFHTVRKIGEQVVDVTMLSILYNEPSDPALFAPPRAWLDDNKEVERILYYNGSFTGLAALQQVQTRGTKALTENTTTGLKIPTTISQKKPNLYFCEQEVPSLGTALQGYDGKIGWAWSELQGYRVMQGAELQQMLGEADMEGPFRLRTLCPLRRLLGEKDENGRRTVGIALATPQGPAGVFYFDTKTFFLVRLETFIQTGPSGELKVVADFSDFRRVDGIMIPFVTVITNPAMRIVTTIQSVQHDVPLDDALFLPRKHE